MKSPLYNETRMNASPAEPYQLLNLVLGLNSRERRKKKVATRAQAYFIPWNWSNSLEKWKVSFASSSTVAPLSKMKKKSEKKLSCAWYDNWVELPEFKLLRIVEIFLRFIDLLMFWRMQNFFLTICKKSSDHGLISILKLELNDRLTNARKHAQRAEMNPKDFRLQLTFTLFRLKNEWNEKITVGDSFSLRRVTLHATLSH